MTHSLRHHGRSLPTPRESAAAKRKHHASIKSSRVGVDLNSVAASKGGIASGDVDALRKAGVMYASSSRAANAMRASGVTERDGGGIFDYDGDEQRHSHVDESVLKKPKCGIGTGDSLSDHASIASDISLVENAHILAKRDEGSEKSADHADGPERAAPPDAFVEGGYNAEFLQHIEPNLKCCICLLVLRDAMQTPCGHRFCQTCIAPVLRGKGPRCPVDRKSLLAVFPDIHCQREIDNIPVKCSNYNLCSWKGVLKDLEEHLLACMYETVVCENEGCGKRTERHRLRQHVDEVCSYRRATCDYCSSDMPYTELESHVRFTCPQLPESCPRGCGESVTRSSKKKHLEDECPESTAICQLGCGQSICRKDMVSHGSDPEFMSQHLHGILASVSRLERQVASKTAIVERQRVELEQLRDEVKEFSVQRNADTVSSPERPSQAVAMLNGASVHGGSPCANVNGDNETADTEQLRCSDSSVGKQLDEMDLRLIELETTSYSGLLVWKIRSFEKILDDAKHGIKMAHYSPPFYAGRTGYKMCARLYPNGDGSGLDNYLSLFFVIMCGEFDALNQWPFARRVTLTLLDQSSARRHISETFEPDRRSSSFHRPTTGMNVASGCPRFVSHLILRSSQNKYLMDDTLFLRVSIDMAGLTCN